MNERPERLLSTLAGTTAIVFGLRKSGSARAISVLGGAAAIAYGAIGRSRIRNEIRSMRAEPEPISRVITVGRPKEELYSKWSDPEFMSSVLADVLQISYEGENRIHVQLSLPGRRTLRWTSQAVEQQPGSVLVWRTEPGAPFPHEMFVKFRTADPGEWGTEIEFGLTPLSGQPMSRLLLGTSSFISKTVLNKVLRRFKALIETGEIPTLAQNPAGRPRILAAA